MTQFRPIRIASLVMAFVASSVTAQETLTPEVKSSPAPVLAPAPAPAAHATPRKAKRPAVAHARKEMHDPHPGHHEEVHGNELAQVRGVVATLMAANDKYMKEHKPGYFKTFADKQTPRATVLTCADSRVQTNVMHGDAVNDLFLVRDIGNQVSTVEGSVEYGVRHLHTPLLLIVGHSACGAIKAASGDYSGLEPAIRRELDTLTLPKGIDPTNGALLNVNNQVDAAIMKFAGELESGHLTVIGAFYDFRNDLKQGTGKLVITNINGETDPDTLRKWIKEGAFSNAAFAH